MAKENNIPDGFPRRSCLDLNTKIELMIYEAIQQVETLGADVKLTNAHIKLQEARDLIADYIDENI